MHTSSDMRLAFLYTDFSAFHPMIVSCFYHAVQPYSMSPAHSAGLIAIPPILTYIIYGDIHAVHIPSYPTFSRKHPSAAKDSGAHTKGRAEVELRWMSTRLRPRVEVHPIGLPVDLTRIDECTDGSRAEELVAAAAATTQTVFYLGH